MITLALDTSTPAPSLALARDGAVLAERQVTAVEAGRRVAEEIHVLLGDAGLAVADLERIVVGIGPGGFTGLRIGMATALALGQALDAEVVGVCSLETLALGMAEQAGGALVVPVIDARRSEVFTAVYTVTPGGVGEVVPPQAADVDAFGRMLGALGRPVVIAGDGRRRVAPALTGEAVILPDGPVHSVRAALAIGWAAAGGARPVAPMYLRLPDAEVNRRRREGRTS